MLRGITREWQSDTLITILELMTTLPYLEHFTYQMHHPTKIAQSKALGTTSQTQSPKMADMLVPGVGTHMTT